MILLGSLVCSSEAEYVKRQAPETVDGNDKQSYFDGKYSDYFDLLSC